MVNYSLRYVLSGCHKSCRMFQVLSPVKIIILDCGKLDSLGLIVLLWFLTIDKNLIVLTVYTELILILN